MPHEHALHILLAWTSPAWPVGAFSYAHGLEAEIAAGRVADAQDLQAWLRTMVRAGTPWTDAVLFAQAHRADPAQLEALSDLAQALATSAERHRETMELGRAFAAAGAAVFGVPSTPRPYPVAVGAAARALDLDLRPALEAFLHGTVSNLVSAAVRFVPLGQTEGQQVLASLFGDIADTAGRALTADIDDIGTACFGADLAAIEHETLTTRIFRT